MSSDQMPAPAKTKLIKFPPSRAGKDIKCPGYARGGGGGMFKLWFDRYIKLDDTWIKFVITIYRWDLDQLPHGGAYATLWKKCPIPGDWQSHYKVNAH